MSSFIQKARKQNPDLTCAYCDRKAEHVHHVIPQSEGGSDSAENLIPVCFYHHHEAHASKGDWRRWGRRGGIVTSRNPFNFLRNLRQFKTWSDEKLMAYVEMKYGVQAVLSVPELVEVN